MVRPRHLFAAAVVLVSGCDTFGAPPDAAVPLDEAIDCEENPYEGNCNPPPPWMPDAMVPACIELFGGGCAECVPSPPRQPDESICTASVCAADPTCCTAIWDERCIDVADARCPDVRCADTIGVGSDGGSAFLEWTGSDLDVELHETAAYRGHVYAVAWSGAELAWIDEGTTDPPVHGRRVRWADFDGDGQTEVVWARVYGAGAGIGIVPRADGYLGDLAVTDLDGDRDLDAIVSFLDGHGLRFYRRVVNWIEPDAAAVGPDAHTIELCDVDGNGARDLLLVEADRLEVYPLVDGLGPAMFPAILGAFAEAACGDLDGDGHDEIIATQNPGAVVAFDAAGQPVWTAPESLPGTGIDTGDLDGDGDVDIIVSEDGPGAHVDIYWNRGETPLAFDHLVSQELGEDLGRLDLTVRSP